jgi:ABC-type transporter MlaC component
MATLAVASTLMFVTAASAETMANDCRAAPFVNSAAAALMRAANGGSPAAFSSAVARFSDIDSIALYALGPYRSKLSKARQQEYFQRTRTYIGKFLAENASRFKADGITINSCKNAGGALVVDSRLSSGERVIWRISGSGTYRVEDVSVQKIWLAQQLRTNFVYKIRSNRQSVDALIDQLG